MKRIIIPIITIAIGIVFGFCVGISMMGDMVYKAMETCSYIKDDINNYKLCLWVEIP